MPPVESNSRFLRSPESGLDNAEFLADAITDSVVDHLPKPLQDTLAGTVRKPLARRLLRGLLVLALALYFAFGALILALRYVVLPEVSEYRPRLEQYLGEATGLKISIRELGAHWVGLQPALRLQGLVVHDKQGAPALQLDEVDARLAWDSLLFFQLRLSQLEILAPNLLLRRDADKRLFVAGLELSAQGSSDNGVAHWLLSQHRIVVRDARIRWQDDARGAPELALSEFNFKFESDGDRHQFGLTAVPPPALATRLDLRGELEDLRKPQTQWQGEVYAAVDDADLAGWKDWIDYPVPLREGHGGLRLWLGFAEEQLRRLTADVRLEQVNVQLRNDLEPLALKRLDGRIGYSRLRDTRGVDLAKLALETRDGIRIAPMDLVLRFTDSAVQQQLTATANHLDLGALSQLAGFLPLDARIAGPLHDYAPHGQIDDLKLSWSDPPAPSPGNQRKWSLDARFSALGVQSDGKTPGVQGLSGQIKGDQSAGQMKLAIRHGSVDLPMVFADAGIALDELDANLEWDQTREGLAVILRSARFEGTDASGDANGTWRAAGNTNSPGIVDLTARVSRANASAVWRYLPLAIGESTREWLRTSLLGGTASNARLRLKGNLADFPFVTPNSGEFDVRGQINDAVLDFADGWPALTDIRGDFMFAGQRMQINVKNARSLGANVRNVVADIADLEAEETVVTLRGLASGPTREFLRYIDSSPVGESIDNFQRTITAEGNGLLDLNLNLPLSRIEQSKILGSYRIDDNRVRIDDLPWISNVRGQLQFSGHELFARNLQGRMLGGLLSADIRTADKALLVGLKGEVTAPGLRSEWALPVLDRLEGSARWNGQVRVSASGIESSLNSNLLGLESSLPVPFAKKSVESRLLSVERKPLPLAKPVGRVDAGGTATPGQTAPAPATSESISVALADTARIELQRQLTTAGPVIRRGIVTLGTDSGTMPERDLLILADLPQFDLDFWRQALTPAGSAADAASPATHTETPAATALPTQRFDLRTKRLRAFDKDFHDIQLTGTRSGMLTRAAVRSAAFNANLSYDQSGRGRLSGNIPHLTIPESAKALVTGTEGAARARDVITRLPAIDLKIDKLAYKTNELGRLHLNAENTHDETPQWNATFSLNNADGDVDGRMAWRPDDPLAQTQVAFEIKSQNVGKTLERLGFADSLRRGSANLAGTLSWQSSPVDPDYPSLTGGFRLTAAKGQFNKLEPGVGRLLGILSLQSLPRRITLDFRDIFSEGFAFDDIEGDFNVLHGLMSTDNLEVNGPAAKVLMKGEIDLVAETQNMRVKVQPALGESLAVGAMLATNPVTGVIAWAAQKLLKNPLDRVFAYDYKVSGSWTDPKVDKLGDEPKTP
jgi:uncharacterized protein (TIGR02099 family)